MTDTSTATITALLDGVTPGPWDFLNPHKWIVDSRGMDLAHIRGWGFLTGKGHSHGGIAHELAEKQMDDNARFIAAARDLVPALLAERDALAAELAMMKPKVKPLVWVSEGRKKWTAENYIISDATKSDVYGGFIWGRVAMGWQGPVPTLADAKAAAQADHEARIMDAIEVTK